MSNVLIKYKLNNTKLSNHTIVALTTTNIRPWDIWEYNLLTLLVIAILGNTLTIIAMRSKNLRSSNTTIFLISLAISDMCFLMTKFLINMQKLYKIPVYEFCIIVKILPDILSFNSYWLIITTTIERFIAVRRPLNVSSLLTKRKCYLISFIILIISILISSTQTVCLQSLPEAPYYCGIKGTINGPCRYYINSIYPGIRSALISWIPSILAIFLNVFIIKALTKASLLRTEMISLLVKHESSTEINTKITAKENTTDLLNQKLSITKNKSSVKAETYRSNSSQESQITIMLCTISLTFVVFTFPYSIYELIRKISADSKQNRNVHRAFLFLIDCLHATNFLMYCLTGKRFRDELKRIFKAKYC